MVIHVGVGRIVAAAPGLVGPHLQVTTVGEHLSQHGPHLSLVMPAQPLTENPDNLLLVIVPQLRLLSLPLI